MRDTVLVAGAFEFNGSTAVRQLVTDVRTAVATGMDSTPVLSRHTAHDERRLTAACRRNETTD